MHATADARRSAPDAPAGVMSRVLRRRLPLAGLSGLDPMQRVAIVKRGVPAGLLALIAEDMAISRDELYTMLGLTRATANRKLAARALLNQDESERVLGIARLVGQVQTMVEQSGEPKGFDAAKWVARWLVTPLPALGGGRPAALMDTADGRAVVCDLIARMQSAAYA